jgi:hypothetical protein
MNGTDIHDPMAMRPVKAAVKAISTGRPELPHIVNL